MSYTSKLEQAAGLGYNGPDAKSIAGNSLPIEDSGKTFDEAMSEIETNTKTPLEDTLCELLREAYRYLPAERQDYLTEKLNEE